ncbi:MAG TPA: hypothetical protein VMZ26_12860, partial [Pyrinomonadaceae bacterium]|nr:hypothetical protein [Pyrinomonadaceae bacterium]
ECIMILRGEADDRAKATAELSIELTARMLLLSGVADSIEVARRSVESKISGGEALERFRKNIECQNGDTRVCDDPEKLFDRNIKKQEIKASRSGFVGAIDTLAIGNALSEIGGGRVRAEDEIDGAVGYECVAQLGEQISAGDPVGILFYRVEAHLESARAKLSDAYTIQSNAPPQTPPLIHEVISA